MAIITNLDVMMAKRKMRLDELSVIVGITTTNLSILKTGKSKAIRIRTIVALCKALECTVDDLLEYRPDIEDAPTHIY